MKDLIIPIPDDFHVHVRQGASLPGYVRDLARSFGRALIMPNTLPPITSAESILKYREEILSAAHTVRPDFSAMMTFKLRADYTENDLINMRQAGAIAGKYYPAGVTTNSQDGISDFDSVFPTIALMEKLGIVLCIHAEEPGVFCLWREEKFIQKVERLTREFPNLKIVFEHVSSQAAVCAVKELSENVAATVTVHHLTMTLDDVVGDALRPHHFCKPLPKFPGDREAIREVVFSGNPKFFLGTDSAPHAKENKECPCGAAGVYSAPVALPILAEEFERAGALDKLADFTSGFGADFYGMPRQKNEMHLIQESWKVPAIVNGVVPMAAEKTLTWKIV